MNRNENEAESFAGNFVASGEERLFFEVPLKDIPSWRDTLVRREGDDEWQKAGGFSELQMFRLTPPPPPSTKIAGDGHVSRKTTFWLITLYFMGALGFHFYLRMSRPFAKIDYQSVA